MIRNLTNNEVKIVSGGQLSFMICCSVGILLGSMACMLYSYCRGQGEADNDNFQEHNDHNRSTDNEINSNYYSDAYRRHLIRRMRYLYMFHGYQRYQYYD